MRLREVGFGASPMTADPDSNEGDPRQGSMDIQEAEMEAMNSHTSLKAIEYVLVAGPAALLLLVYLFGNLVIRSQFDAPKACRLNDQTEYAAPRG
jgi:hypothetical protein